MLLELGLPSFDTLLYNSRMRFANQVQHTSNSIIAQLRLIFSFAFVCVMCVLCFNGFSSFSSFLCLSCLTVYLWYGLVPEIKPLIDWLIDIAGLTGSLEAAL